MDTIIINNNNNNNNNANNNNTVDPTVWRERERRQRTIRLLLSFLFMLLLMDNDKDNQMQYDKNNAHLRRRSFTENDDHRANKHIRNVTDLYRTRQQDRIEAWARTHERYLALVHDWNDGVDVQSQVEESVKQAANNHKNNIHKDNNNNNNNQNLQQRVYHYPWNSTGYYQGGWKRVNQTAPSANATASNASNSSTIITPPTTTTILDAVALESVLAQSSSSSSSSSSLQSSADNFGVRILPWPYAVEMRNDHNLTAWNWEELRLDANSQLLTSTKTTTSAPSSFTTTTPSTALPLTRDNGGLALQLFSRSVPNMTSLSLVDGFVKFFDAAATSGGTWNGAAAAQSPQDVLIRVRGVLFHSIGQLSLVSTPHAAQSVLYMPEPADSYSEQQERRLLETTLSQMKQQGKNHNIDQPSVRDSITIRDSVISLYHEEFGQGEWRRLVSFPSGTSTDLQQRRLTAADETTTATPASPSSDKHYSNATTATTEPKIPSPFPRWSEIVLPYPFVHDDPDETVRRVKTPAARELRPRDQSLEENAAGCSFELTLNVSPIGWPFEAWQQLLLHHGDTEVHRRRKDQALVQRLVGNVHSPDCHFAANLNATALRTDWETVTSRAVRYSFGMMVVCLIQMLTLLRQVLHSQGNSAAVRVSLLTMGWQTMIDALLCIMHIYMSIAVPSLFSAFASISFFKVLLFGIIEMKYMAILVQARLNSNGGGQTAETLRRQLALLHVRFYSVLAAAFVAWCYAGGPYRLYFYLALYSFWCPQIVLNVITQAKTPLHDSYILWVSLSRLLAPIYFLGIKHNFLYELSGGNNNADIMYDPTTAWWVVLWVGLQTAILWGQRTWGARFLIPAVCLPPKFDYSRPIPESMLPAESLSSGPPTRQPMEDREHQPSVVVVRHHRSSQQTTRHRNRPVSKRPVMTTEQHHTAMAAAVVPSVPPLLLECSICYEGIDVQRRHEYMLAPCQHLFHRDCLMKWMEVKMECPICRTDLPAV